MESLKYGYLNYNTRYIPKNINEKLINVDGNFEKFDNIYIKSDKPIEIEVISDENDTSIYKIMPYTITSGEHFIPYYFTKQNIKILNGEGVEMYKCSDYKNNFEIVNDYICIIETIEHYDTIDHHTKYKFGLYYNCDYPWIYTHKSIESGLLRYICRTFEKDFIWIDYYDCYQFKNKNDYMYSHLICHEDIHIIQKDKEVTVFLDVWDKDLIRYESGSCILVTYNEKKFNNLQKVLKKKYKYILNKPEPIIIKKLKTYENIYLQIAEHNKKLKTLNKAFNFVTVEEIPFTLEVYNQLKEINDTPLEKLIPINLKT